MIDQSTHGLLPTITGEVVAVKQQCPPQTMWVVWRWGSAFGWSVVPKICREQSEAEAEATKLLKGVSASRVVIMKCDLPGEGGA